MTSALRLVTAGLFFALTASAAFAADPTGNWQRPSTGTVVKFYSCGANLCAKIVSVKDKSKQGTVGTVIMAGAKKISDSKWEGDLLNTDDGQTYNGVVTVAGDGLTLKGCVLGGIICKGETWSRVN